MTHGSSHALTDLSASGHDTWGLLFSPSRRFGRQIVLRLRHLLDRQATKCPPAERKRQAHQLPVSSYGYVAPDLVVAPSQSVLDLLVALLHPHPQTVEPDHLSDARGGEITLNFPL